MVGPQGAQDEVVNCGVGLVPGVVETIVLCLEVNQPVWLNTNPLHEERGKCIKVLIKGEVKEGAGQRREYDIVQSQKVADSLLHIHIQVIGWLLM